MESGIETKHQSVLASSNESQFSIFYNAYNLQSYDSSNSSVPDLLDSLGSDSDSLLKLVFLGMGISIVGILGVIGNLLSVVVLSNARMRTSISCLLIGLAICDTIILVNAIFAFGIPTILSFSTTNMKHGSVSPFLRFGRFVPFVFGISLTAITGSVYFTLAVTLERYFAVCQPFFARRICTWRRASQFSLGIVALAIFYNLPRWWEYTCVTAYGSGDDAFIVIGCRPIPSALRINAIYDVYYVNILYLLVHYAFPICCLVVFNVLIYFKIRQANENRKILSKSQLKENSLAYMLFTVVAVFIFCNSLPPFHAIWRVVTGSDPTPVIEVVRTFLLVFNSSVNFVIYCAYGEKFRDVFLNIMFPRRRSALIDRFRQGSDLSDFSRKLEAAGRGSAILKIYIINGSLQTICDRTSE